MGGKRELFLDESALDDVVAWLTDMRRHCEAPRIQQCTRIGQHPRAAASHHTVFLRIQLRKVQICGQLAGLNQCRQPSVVGMWLASDCWVVVEPVPDQLTQELVAMQRLDGVLYYRALTN